MTPTAEPRSLVPPAGWLEDGEPLRARAGAGAGFLLLVTLLGALLRAYRLTGQSLWIDELLTLQMIRPEHGLVFFEQMRDSIQGPLYPALLWPLVRLQESALMLRLPALLAGVATVPVFGHLAGRWFGTQTGRLAALLLAVNPFLVWYSQEGRGYSCLALFSVLMALAFARAVRDGIDGPRAAGFAAATAGAVWSNQSGLFLWLALGLGLILLWRPRDRRAWLWWTGAFAGGLLAVSPWLLRATGIWAVDRLVPGAAVGEALRGETTFSPLALPYTLHTFFYGFSLGPSLRELHQPDRLALVREALPLLVAGALPAAAGLLAVLWKPDRRVLQLLLWILVPVAVLAILAVRNVKPWNPRYVLTTLPWVLLLTARGLTRLPRRTGGAAVLLLLGLSLWSLGNHYWNPRYAKAEIRGAAAVVAERNLAGETVVVPAVGPVFRFYYDGAGEVRGVSGATLLASRRDAEGFLATRLGDLDACWLVLGREWFFDPHGVLLPALAEAGSLRREANLPGARVYHWRRRSAPPQEAHGAG